MQRRLHSDQHACHQLTAAKLKQGMRRADIRGRLLVRRRLLAQHLQLQGGGRGSAAQLLLLLLLLLLRILVQRCHARLHLCRRLGLVELQLHSVCVRESRQPEREYTASHLR